MGYVSLNTNHAMGTKHGLLGVKLKTEKSENKLTSFCD